MGAIKPTYIKSLAKQLLKEVPDFTDDFDVDKKMVEKYTNIESKAVRNRVAGYIAHKKRREGKK
ncbi:MAG: 30S ribosomal protein S17e [archaeon]|nr:30S ribosomal protein S17e [Methanophagales archaeon]MDI6811539.1 30S ribosomal protein S17e [archaeon]